MWKRINDMKSTWHLCLSAGEEILFRDLEDYHRGFNTFALTLCKTDSNGLVESFMSNHCHLMIQTSSPSDFMHTFRLSYSMYFNKKYSRKGRLGERMHFSMEMVGYHHTMAAASYTLRNALHHGIVPIPYAYPHCSVNSIFMREMGKSPEQQLLHPRYHHRYLGKTAEYPDTYKMSSSGLFLRETVLDIPQVENMFMTPRVFNYYMSRKSSEEWEAEQHKDKNDRPAVTLGNIEPGHSIGDVEKMLIYENGKADYRRPTDMDVCSIIDDSILKQYGKTSVYLLTEREKQMIAESLYRHYRIGERQIRRCLVL